MSEPIEVESLVRLDLKPGEMLAVVAPQASTHADMAEMSDRLGNFLDHAGLDWTYAVFPYGTRIEAVRGVQESCQCDTHTHPQIERDVLRRLQASMRASMLAAQ